MDSAKEIASCLEALANKQVHLVLPASMKRADLTRCIRDYAVFHPDYLLFTKLDETESQGAILSAALEADKPLSFFANGQNIPEDIEPAHARACCWHRCSGRKWRRRSRRHRWRRTY